VYTALIRRQENLKYHPGQLSLPGGRRERNESFMTAALRETHEEVGLDPKMLTMLGGLAPVYIPPSDYCVHPFAAWHDGTPVFKLSAEEVAEIFEIPVERLLHPASRGVETRDQGPQRTTIPYFKINEHRAWGATAMILNEFLERLQAALHSET